MKNLLIPLMIIIGLSYSYAQTNTSIIITQPRNGATVTQMRNTICLRFENKVPAGKSIVLFIQDPNGNWWPYLNISPAEGTNSRQIKNIQFGQQVDNGMSFNIQALIIDNFIKTKGIRLEGATVFVCGGCELTMPKYAALRKLYPKYASPIVTVIRR